MDTSPAYLSLDTNPTTVQDSYLSDLHAVTHASRRQIDVMPVQQERICEEDSIDEDHFSGDESEEEDPFKTSSPPAEGKNLSKDKMYNLVKNLVMSLEGLTSSTCATASNGIGQRESRGGGRANPGW